MIATTTGRLLGRLELEFVVPTFDPQFDSFRPAATYRPKGIVLDNDGRWHHWLAPEEPEPYTLDRDDYGWVVRNPRWTTDHTFRIGDGSTRERRAVDYLPLADGEVIHLDPAKSYRISKAAGVDGVAFELHEAA